MKNLFLPNFFQVLFISLTVVLVYYKFQPQILVGDGKGWDGISYNRVYEHFRGEALDSTVIYPFCKRVGLPYLASKLNFDPKNSFLMLNLAFGMLSVFVCWLALIKRYSGLTVWACLLPIYFNIFSPLRFPNFYPFTVDPPAFFLYAVSSFFLVRGNFWGCIVALVISCFFRESGIYFAVLTALALLYAKDVGRYKGILMLLVALSGVVFIPMIQDGGCSGSQLATILDSIKEKITNPFGLLKLLASISLTLGPFFIGSRIGELVGFDKNDVVIRINGLMLILSIIMAAFGGSDTTRILYLSFPLYVLYLARIFNGKNHFLVAFVSIAGMIANRFISKIPEPENYFLNNDVAGWFSFLPETGHIAVALVILIYWIFIFWIAKFIRWDEVFKVTLKIHELIKFNINRQ
jgi:hypothetical protein